jgi:3-phosphoshikimate 1-carboxyvinyltransferase
MTNLHIKKSKLHGSIQIPPSKSHTLRSILFGSMGSGRTCIDHYLPSHDTQAMIQACQHFGASIQQSPLHLEIKGIHGKISHSEDVIYAGNSGIILRFCSALGALSTHPVVVTGDHSIRHQRPMHHLLDGLKQLGASVSSMRGDGFAPLIIQGPLKNGQATIQGEDSQPVSALLIAAAFAENPIEIQVKNPGEKPWVAMTLHWFNRLGIPYENHSYLHYKMKGSSSYPGFHYQVPGDLSSAAFPLVAAIVTHSELILSNVDMRDIQGDKEVVYLLKKMGAQLEIDEQEKKLFVKPGTVLHGAKIDVNDCIDALPILAVAACYAQGTTHLTNAAIAKQKECDRLQCITRELRKMGAAIEELEDGLVIHGKELQGNRVDSHGDHRLAMSLAVAGLGAQGETIVTNIDCIAKTFPAFVQNFTDLNASFQLSQG